MTFVEELVQLLIIILALLFVLFGVNFWTKKGGSISLPSMGSGSSPKADAQHMAGIDGVDAENAQESGALQSSGGGGKSKGKGGSSGADRHGDRFDLTGKDAEAAARVLKRMLKQDEKFKNQSEQ